MDNPKVILSWGVSIGFGLAGLGVLVKFLFPALAAMFAIAMTIITGGVVASAFGAWVIPAASVGLAIGGGAIGIVVLAKIVKEAKKNPYEWAMPILAIIAGLVVDTCKELSRSGGGDEIIKAVYGASVSSLFLLGGILWQQQRIKIRGFGLRIISVVLFMFAPFLVYFRYAQVNGLAFSNAYQAMHFDVVMVIVVLLISLLLVAVISWAVQEKEISD
jgi:hypothetical protein